MENCVAFGPAPEISAGRIFEFDLDLEVDIGWREFTVTLLDAGADAAGCFGDLKEGETYPLGDFQVCVCELVFLSSVCLCVCVGECMRRVGLLSVCLCECFYIIFLPWRLVCGHKTTGHNSAPLKYVPRNGMGNMRLTRVQCTSPEPCHKCAILYF